MNTTDAAKAYIIGGGIASLSAAVLLIRDGGFCGANIHILEELEVAGGALDGSGDPVKGYVTRGGRMWTEEAYVCLWNVLDSIPNACQSDKIRQGRHLGVQQGLAFSFACAPHRQGSHDPRCHRSGLQPARSP